MIHLRPYQENCISEIRNSLKYGKKAPLLVAPTGSGKTVMFAYIAQNTSSRAKRVWILVHRIELLRQTSKALMELGVKHGIINPKFTPNTYAQVQVASVQTLIRRMDKYPPPDLIIIDEAHHAVGKNTWGRVLESFPRAFKLGVTATPCRSDGIGLGVEAGGHFDDLIIGPTVSELIELGFLVNPIIYAPPTKLDLTGLRTKMGDYEKKELASRVDKPTITGNAIDHYKRICPGTPAVVFCVSVEHAKHVAEEFRSAGFKAQHADGSLEDDQRKRILNGLDDGYVQVVTSCDLISEGTDIPAIGCAILLRPTQSKSLFLQQVGRALRPCKGKDRAIILDHVGNVLNHGLPTDERDWSLEGEQKKKRGKKKEEPTVKLNQCESCFAMFEPQPVCPQCGTVRKLKEHRPKEVEGELMAIDEVRAAQIKKQSRMEVGKAQSLKELEAIARQRGYKPGWARHVWKAKQDKLRKSA